MSNGDLAQTNDVRRNEATVHSTWTINTTCTTPVDCTGRITSDAGWTAEVNIAGSEYVAKRDIPNWEPCPNGTSRAGHQIYRFYPVDDRGQVSVGSTTFAGIDRTLGDSGACGINKALDIHTAVPAGQDRLTGVPPCRRQLPIERFCRGR